MQSKKRRGHHNEEVKGKREGWQRAEGEDRPPLRAKITSIQVHEDLM